MELAIARSSAADRSSFVVSGDLDMRTGPELQQAVVASIGPRPGCVDLDLSAIRFMDSSGLLALVELRREVEAAGGSLSLAGVPAPVLRILQLTGLEGFFLDAASPAPARPPARATCEPVRPGRR